ncbi:tetratricopeptide repeat protein [Alsobacter sp. R-9]
MSIRVDVAQDPVTRHVTGSRIDEVFALVMDLPHRKPAVSLPRRLDSLFRELSHHEPARHPDDIEDLIWAHWISHPDSSASGSMAIAIEAMGAGALDLALPVLDDLVEAFPDWAEAWNKRGTLHFVEKRDAAAVDDIARALQLEPRHFGAVSGFGQVCLRQGRFAEAKAVFQVALRINPHLEGLREAIVEIGDTDRGLLH